MKYIRFSIVIILLSLCLPLGNGLFSSAYSAVIFDHDGQHLNTLEFDYDPQVASLDLAHRVEGNRIAVQVSNDSAIDILEVRDYSDNESLLISQIDIPSNFTVENIVGVYDDKVIITVDYQYRIFEKIDNQIFEIQVYSDAIQKFSSIKINFTELSGWEIPSNDFEYYIKSVETNKEWILTSLVRMNKYSVPTVGLDLFMFRCNLDMTTQDHFQFFLDHEGISWTIEDYDVKISENGNTAVLLDKLDNQFSDESDYVIFDFQDNSSKYMQFPETDHNMGSTSYFNILGEKLHILHIFHEGSEFKPEITREHYILDLNTETYSVKELGEIDFMQASKTIILDGYIVIMTRFPSNAILSESGFIGINDWVLLVVPIAIVSLLVKSKRL